MDLGAETNFVECYKVFYGVFLQISFILVFLFLPFSVTKIQDCRSTHLHFMYVCNVGMYVYVVVQFYPWFKFYFPLFLGMVMYDNEFETKENKI